MFEAQLEKLCEDMEITQAQYAFIISNLLNKICQLKSPPPPPV
jgi:hypothetical protein